MDSFQQAEECLLAAQYEKGRSILYHLITHSENEEELFAGQILLGESYRRESRFIEAGHFYAVVYQNASALENAYWALRAKASLAYLAYLQKDFTQALHWLDTCISASKHASYLDLEAFCLGIKGEIFCSGHGANGQILIKELQSLKPPPERTDIEQLRIEDFRTAQDFFRRSLHIYESLRNQHGIARQTSNLGRISFNFRKYLIARKHFEQARKMFLKLGDISEVATQYNNLGAVKSELSGIHSGLPLFKESIKLRNKVGNLAGVASTQELAGQYFYLTTQEEETAKYWFKKSIETIEKYKHNLSNSYLQHESYIGDLFEVYHKWIDLLCRQYFTPDHETNNAVLCSQIFNAVEHTKSHALLVHTLQNPDVPQQEPHVLILDQIATFEKEISALETQIIRAKAQREILASSEIDRLRWLQAELRGLKLIARFISNPIHEPASGLIPTLEEFQTTLEASEVFISYFSALQNVFAMEITREAVHIYFLGAKQDMNRLILQYRKGIRHPSFWIPDVYVSGAFPLWAFLGHNGRLFSDHEKTYYISTELEIGQISIDSLATSPSASAPAFAGLLFKTSYFPSASFYHYLRSVPDLREDKLFDVDFLGIGISKGSHFRPLDSVEEQLTKLETLFNDTAILSINEPKETVLSYLSHPARVTHIITHGFSDTDGQDLSEPTLWLYDEFSSEGSYLRASDVFGMQVPRQLVTLAACETGLGVWLRGEGTNSLARSFLGSQSSCVIASLWNVSERVTSFFTERFYFFLQSMSIFEAFHEARKETAQQHPLPIEWGPYIILGNGHTRIPQTAFNVHPD